MLPSDANFEFGTLAGTTGVALNRFALLFFFDPAHCHAGRNSSARSESTRLSFWSHRSDAATRDRIELSFAAVHESLVVKVFGCRPHDGGAAHTGAGVRKPPMEETAMGERMMPRS